MWRVGLWVLFLTLVVTNLLTWRALHEARLEAVLSAKSRLAPPGEGPLPSPTYHPGNSAPVAPHGTAMNLPPAGVHANSASATPVAEQVSGATYFRARLARQLTDPVVHQALHNQQRGQTLMAYGELLKKWHAPEAVLDALTDYRLKAVTSGNASSNAADDNVLSSLLTSKQLEELRDYDLTLPDRESVNMYVAELEIANIPLATDKVEQLLHIMSEERVSAAPMPADTMAYRDWHAALDQQILDRAAPILTSDQLSKLEAFQHAQNQPTLLFVPDSTVADATGKHATAGSTGPALTAP
jgi:hypothetical protein